MLRCAELLVCILEFIAIHSRSCSSSCVPVLPVVAGGLTLVTTGRAKMITRLFITQIKLKYRGKLVTHSMCK